VPSPRLARRRLIAGLLLAAPLAAVGCVRVVPPGGATPAASAAGSLVARPASDEWPRAFRAASARTQAAYRYAVANPNLLEHVPCYCGCAASGHRSNLDCYVEARSGALVTLDAHGFGCDTCAAITLEVREMAGRGLTHREVREAIDTRWRTVGPATTTGWPPA
jgi:Protein of unknown function with PCYCGC motif